MTTPHIDPDKDWHDLPGGKHLLSIACPCHPYRDTKNTHRIVHRKRPMVTGNTDDC